MASSLRNLSKLSPIVRNCAQRHLPASTLGVVRCCSTGGKKWKEIDQFTSQDGYFEKYQHRQEEGGLAAIDPTNRAYTYMVLGSARFAYASLGRLAAIKIVTLLNITKADLALAMAEIPLTGVKEGDAVSVKWQGAPAYVKCRTQEEIEQARAEAWQTFRDPQSDEERCQGNDPKWVVVMANCTHLGCIPQANAGHYQGFFCPCHGSHYDNCGRIRAGPAPLNLKTPPYIVEGDMMIIG